MIMHNGRLLSVLVALFFTFWSNAAQDVIFCKTTHPFTHEKGVTDIPALTKAAEAMLAYIKNSVGKPTNIVTIGLLGHQGYRLKDVCNTLEFIVSTTHEDIAAKRDFRLLDPHFLQKNFTCLWWMPQNNINRHTNIVAPPPNKVYWTKYRILEVQGSLKKTPAFGYPLYAVPSDEQGVAPAVVEKNKKKFTRFLYTKKQILEGALDKNPHITPLVWLSREDFEEALMQGTIIVHLPNGSQKILNAHRHNDIPYNHHASNRREQDRYFYFREVTTVSGKTGPVFPGITLAADIEMIGLGKIIALQATNKKTGVPELRLGLVADTGGALTNTHDQIDWFAGVYKNIDTFNEQVVRQLPSFANAYVLIKK